MLVSIAKLLKTKCMLIQFFISFSLFTLAWTIVAPERAGGLSLKIVVTNQLDLLMRKYILDFLHLQFLVHVKMWLVNLLRNDKRWCCRIIKSI